MSRRISFYLLLIVVFSVFTNKQLYAANQLVTQLNVVDNDSTFLYVYVYNDLGNKVMETKYFHPDSLTLIRKSLTEWIYDGANIITQRERSWKNGAWCFNYLIDYYYNNNLLTTEIHSNYIAGIISQFKKVEFIYQQTKLLSKIEYLLDNDLWHKSTQTDFTYLPDLKPDTTFISAFKSDTLYSKMYSTYHYNLTGTVNSQCWKIKSANSWINSDSINWYYYSNTDKILTQKNKKWNAVISAWENTQRIDYMYNASNQVVSESYQKWKTMFWENDVRYDYTYSADNVLLKKTLMKPVYNDWRGLVSVNYSDIVANNSNTVQSSFEFWGGVTGQLTTSFIPFVFNNEIIVKRAKSIKISYLTFNDTILTTKITENAKMAHVYPNPSNGVFYVNARELGLKSWSVSDLNGRLVKTNDQTYQNSVIDLTDLPRGIYLLKVRTEDAVLFQKLLKE